MATIRLRAQLRDVGRTVVRVLDLPARATLADAHLVLQAGFGWTDSHLHEVEADGARYAPPEAEDTEALDERRARVTDLPARWVYVYDLGDAWTHDVDVLGAGGDAPGCVYAEGECPAEDSRGTGATRPGVDQDEAGERVRRVLGRVPSGVRLVLDVVGPGVRLTPRGRLPRATVREVASRRPDWALDPDRPAHREEDLLPLAGLHDLLLEARVLRVRDRTLVPTRAAADDAELVRRLRGRFAPDTFVGLCAHLGVVLLVMHGELERETLERTLFDLVGAGWRVDGRRLDVDDVGVVLAQLGGALEALGQVDPDRGPGRAWRPGPEACWLFPRAGLLAP